MTAPNLNEINANIQAMKQAAQTLHQLGEDFPAINRNVARIQASIKMLEINISDIVELAADQEA